jgi:V8-like Glu-specific endopeptidase
MSTAFTTPRRLKARLSTRLTAVALASSIGWLSATAHAADEVVVNAEPPAAAMREPDAKQLRPIVNLLGEPEASEVVPDLAPTPQAGGFKPGRDPSLRQPGDGEALGDAQGQAAPMAFGSFGVPYTTTRVQDGNMSATGTTTANRLSATFPYRAVGKLTSSSGWCSASLIRRSVIVTAAHCVQNFGAGATLFTNFQFRPGHYGAAGATAAQQAPHGSFGWLNLVRPATWANGTDIGSGSARDNDIAVIALRKNAAGQFVGNLTGWLGYGWNNYSFVSHARTGNMNVAAVTTLGYPAHMDAGAIMQRTDGPAYTATVGGARQIYSGSNFTGGSSGGPWTVNFSGRSATLSGGAASGTASNMAVVGVTSWGSANPNAPKDNYSSQFRQNTRYPNASYGVYGSGNIASLLNTLCSSAAPEGGTLAQRGYCD